MTPLIRLLTIYRISLSREEIGSSKTTTLLEVIPEGL